MASSGTFEVREGLGVAGPDLLHGLLDEVQRHGRRIGDEVDAGPVALDRVAPLRHFHSNSVSGSWALLGSEMRTELPVALT